MPRFCGPIVFPLGWSCRRRRYSSRVPESSQPGRVGDLGQLVGITVGCLARSGGRNRAGTGDGEPWHEQTDVRGTDRDAPTLEGFLRLPSYVHPVSSGANVLARVQKRDSLFLGLFVSPFASPALPPLSLLLYQALFFYSLRSRLTRGWNSPGIGRLTLEALSKRRSRGGIFAPPSATAQTIDRCLLLQLKEFREIRFGTSFRNLLLVLLRRFLRLERIAVFQRWFSTDRRLYEVVRIGSLLFSFV